MAATETTPPRPHWYRDRVFPWILERAEGPEVFRWREATVREAAGRVLEIGFGTGKTLRFYDPEKVERLTVLEPAPGMRERAEARLARAAFQTELVALPGESLPFDDGHFDSVVITMTLCSVDEPDQVLAETLRVLRPGGRYHFLEHVANERPGPRRWQHALNPLFNWIGCGCNLIRDTESAIRRAGFEISEIARRRSKDMPVHPEIFPVIQGVAVRPAP